MIEINKMSFTPRDDCNYKYDYVKAVKLIKGGEWEETAAFKQLVLNDLWFIIYFVLGIKSANHPFVIEQCKEVEKEESDKTFDCWARGHFKSSIITIGETIQYHLKYPDRCSIIFSYKKGLAETFLSSVKRAYEGEFLRVLFPDILFEDPQNHSPLWSIEKGITVKRVNQLRKEPTVYASGLVEGMATGFHSERLIFDDIETADMARSVTSLNDCFEKYKMALYMGTKTDNDKVRVIGTYYSHLGALVKISKENYKKRIQPATKDGSWDGEPVLFSQKQLDEEKKNKHYPMQMLCNPTPIETLVLRSEYIKEVEQLEIPKSILKWQLIDWAGDNAEGSKGCSWAVMILGIDPRNTEDIGSNNIYILDGVISPMGTSEAIEEICRMYLRNGILQALCLEKNISGALELHIKEILERRGRSISKERGNLILLNPAGRKKDTRIEQAITWSLNNGKIHMLKSISPLFKERLKEEMNTFPYGNKDGIDCLAYFWDVIKDAKLQRYNDVIDIEIYRTPFKMKTAVA